VRYELVDGEALELLHDGEPVALASGAPQTRPTLPAPKRRDVPHPPGRGPLRRHDADE
jgi:alpha,alpha-trehalose phosphorylase